MDTPESAPSILLAEDEETEIILLQLAFQSAGLDYRIIVTHDGQEAIDYLAGRPPYDNRSVHPLPTLLMLDLKMPRMTGFDVLSWLASQPQLRHIPALVLSSSAYPNDMQKADQLGAREYLIKPHTLAELVNVLKTATSRWLEPRA